MSAWRCRLTCYRTENDVQRMNELGARVRLVKGAYKEPASVAFQQKAEVDAAFLRLMRLLLDEGTYPAIATHDEQILTETARYAAARAVARRPLRVSDAVRHPARPPGVARRAADISMRIYVPFGREWFPYFMRRLGERPANVAIRRSAASSASARSPSFDGLSLRVSDPGRYRRHIARRSGRRSGNPTSTVVHRPHRSEAQRGPRPSGVHDDSLAPHLNKRWRSRAETRVLRQLRHTSQDEEGPLDGY